MLTKEKPKFYNCKHKIGPQPSVFMVFLSLTDEAIFIKDYILTSLKWKAALASLEIILNDVIDFE